MGQFLSCVKAEEQEGPPPPAQDDLKHTKSSLEIDLLRSNSFSTLPVFTWNGITKHAKVVKVIDGDTCHIVFVTDSGQPYRDSFRFLGVDCPEMKPVKTTPHLELHKKAATLVRDTLSRILLAQGSLVRIEFSKKEKFGRLMGKIFKSVEGGQLDIVQWLVDQNMGMNYFGSKKGNPSFEWLQKCCTNCEAFLALTEDELFISLSRYVQQKAH